MLHVHSMRLSYAQIEIGPRYYKTREAIILCKNKPPTQEKGVVFQKAMIACVLSSGSSDIMKLKWAALIQH